ncbi:MAG: hypothetical protein AB9842_06355 [Bacteroidales bacterium]
MKKEMVRLFILISICMSIMYSCSKLERNNQKNNDAGDDLIPHSDAEIEQRIRTFKQQCEFLIRNPGLKNSSMMNYDDAFWLMEASLNYSFGYPGESSQITRLDSCMITIPKVGEDSIIFQDIAVGYEKLVDSLNLIFSGTSWSDKHVLLADLNLFDMTDPEEYTLKMSVVIGKVTDEPIPFGNPFSDTDYWFWSGMQGQCGPYFPSGYGTDASIIMSQYQSWFHPQIQVNPGSHFYFTDIEEVNIKANDYLNPDDITPHDNHLDYLSFYSDVNLPNYHECLDPGEMWFYLMGLFSIATDNDKACSLTNPPFKDFMSLTIQPCTEDMLRIYYNIRLKYGIRHLSNDSSYPVPILSYK